MKRHFEFASNANKEVINDSVMLEVECSKTGGGLCDMMGVTGFPTIMLIHKGKSMKYTSGRTHGAIVQFLSDKSQWLLEALPPKVAALALEIAADAADTAASDDEDEDNDEDNDEDEAEQPARNEEL